MAKGLASTRTPHACNVSYISRAEWPVASTTAAPSMRSSPQRTPVIRAERKRDIAQINRNGAVDPDSNYAFGEGGAGTFSDGKLFTRSKKRGDYHKALQTLVFHGASDGRTLDAFVAAAHARDPPVAQVEARHAAAETDRAARRLDRSADVGDDAGQLVRPDMGMRLVETAAA